MNGLVATRNTCFALISAIEEDFRALCIALGDGRDLLPEDVRTTARRRRQADLRMDAEVAEITDIDLLPYIDFADIAKVIDSKIGPKHDAHRSWLSSTAKSLLSLTQARNRVCHTRPLETDDFPGLVDFSKNLTSPTSPFAFPTVHQTHNRLQQDPGFVLTLQIPSFWAEKSKTHHNLPIPEFDETGFFGRQSERLQILKLLKSHYPVVTIVGEGGIGKTALALRCLYDILEEGGTFDAIIWVSLKTSALTATGVRQLNGAITSTLGLLSELARQLGPTPATRGEQEYIDEIAEYLNLYRILIAVDNLETISIGPLRDLLLKVPASSKILLTSRVGVGEFEARYPLQGLDERAAIALTRANARVFGVTALQKLDDGNIKGYCRKLFFNPLLIKWFVTGVARGADPNALTSKEGDNFPSALSYCFQNLFDRFGIPERSVIGCLASARKPLTSSEIHFLMPELSTHELEVALVALHNSSIVIRTKKGSDGFEYFLSESTSSFVDQHSPPSPEFFKDIQGRLRDLRVVLTQESILEGRYEYDPFFVRSGTGRDERICATYLRKALDALKRGEADAARKESGEARKLAPQSGEVWRISALVEETLGDHYKAYQYYENSVDIDPYSKITRYCFGQFLMQDMDELDGAIQQLDTALKADPDSPPLLTSKAMALNRKGLFSESASIHETLLESIASRERRWRLTGVDQAADCYRRWGFRAWEQKEYESAKDHFKRAISIIFESAERGDIDDKLLVRTAKVVSDSLCRREFVADQAFSEFILNVAERIRDLSSGQSIPFISHGHYALKQIDSNHPLHKRLIDLDRSYANAEAISASLALIETPDGTTVDGRRLGTVHNLQSNFGFIAERDGSRWFFHRNFLLPNLRWEDLKPGTLVSFSLGHNERGECAVDVGYI